MFVLHCQREEARILHPGGGDMSFTAPTTSNRSVQVFLSFRYRSSPGRIGTTRPGDPGEGFGRTRRDTLGDALGALARAHL